MIPNTLQSNEEGFQYAQSLRGIAERIAFELGDSERGEEFQTYDDKWVQARVLDTLKWLQGRKPSLFSEEVEFTISAGDTHRKPADCDRLMEITQVIDSRGNCFPVCESDFKDLKASLVWRQMGNHCTGNASRYNYAFNPNDMDQFILTPALFTEAKVKATCSNVSRFLKDPDLLIECEVAKYINTIVEYVLYVAMSMDSENVTIAALANTHRSTFFDLAPVKRSSTDDRDR